MDAISILEKINGGEITPEDVVKDSIAKIESENKRLNAAVEILRDDALSDLKNHDRGILNGLPVSVKECYAIKGKRITSGSQRMKPIECHEDAAVIKKLKAAGAIIVARGNSSEFLLGRETDNLVFGTTYSCINPQLTAGGSSGGDGSMVGSDCVTIGIGTDIGGSCRYPAVFNGIVGFRPASGQVDKSGIFPLAGHEFTETMNSPGILCKSVRDARLVYNVIGNKKLAEISNLTDANIYTSKNFRVSIKDESIQKAMNEVVPYFSSINMTTTDISIPEDGELFNHFNTLIFAGFRDKIYEWSTTSNGEKLSYAGELLRRWTGHPTLSKELFAILLPFNLMKPSQKKLSKTIQRVKELRVKYQSLLGKNGILILPTMGVLAPHSGKFYPQYNKPGIIDIITPVSFCNVLNLSCITIPNWKFQRDKNSTPPSIQLIAADGSEELLLNVAEQLMNSFAN
jgi:Asp-tRNA(Asn)/Glu-tRNA(Gln) amidotransferase A subunit family amidase